MHDLGNRRRSEIRTIGTVPEGFVRDVKRSVPIGPVSGHQASRSNVPRASNGTATAQFIIDNALMQEE